MIFIFYKLIVIILNKIFHPFVKRFISLPTIIVSMEQKSIEHLIKALSHWSTADVRAVPGVMYQVICEKDDIDNNIEYRFHWFLDCTETYIHNHRYTFDTYCLEGEYMEKLWNIDDGTTKTTYQFPRAPGNKLGPYTCIPGALRIDTYRRHFPGNILHVETKQYHSISPSNHSNNHVVTFVSRQICQSAAANTYILSPTESIEAPIEEARPATFEERRRVYFKLLRILQR